MKLKIWWRPNFIETEFEIKVMNHTEAYLALEILSNLDLEGGHKNTAELLKEFPRYETFFSKIESAYKKYRQSYGINGAWLITDNMGGLLVWNEDESEWEDFCDPIQDEDLSWVVEHCKENGIDYKKVLLDLSEGVEVDY